MALLCKPLPGHIGKAVAQEVVAKLGEAIAGRIAAGVARHDCQHLLYRYVMYQLSVVDPVAFACKL